MNKTQLRRQILERRKALSSNLVREKSNRLCAHLQTLPLWTESKTILAYQSFRQELDLSSLFVRDDKIWGLPRCDARSLVWHCWKPGEPLQKGSYGIFEPTLNAPLIKPQEVNLILVPAVACDRAGYRLGYGGGFYDRMFQLQEWSSQPRIGIIFNFALVRKLPVEDWDCPLQGVCTEEGWEMFDA
ncbi:5-formyltetrahydrofolate cyclo-ligase [Lusitaniella coriacea LEGE 07157]|uniref:5-formyltetrahydrofolate cyclo-ligase n=1 Tax=Lusitaniella coriacea LEGE 07157 TaxID=945747 RepID=A0A8J7DLD9_9CYAN|nr:5-formyltetrahydrofolate cyclo-ligase [Lusitaniella coriacea]MBE9114863.1 5-formyltetrahydrofolate cyclo-ligase [Lusitaniella coriacea LEGE 07157]